MPLLFLTPADILFLAKALLEAFCHAQTANVHCIMQGMVSPLLVQSWEVSEAC